MAENVSVDYDSTAQFVSKLRAQADQIESETPHLTRAVLDSFTREASQGTRDGKPSPIYDEAVAAMSNVMHALDSHFKKIAAKLRSGAHLLESATAEIKQHDEDGAAAVRAVDLGLDMSNSVEKGGAGYSSIPRLTAADLAGDVDKPAPVGDPHARFRTASNPR